ncbi:hypothetical protein NFC81_08185 [Salinispirillum sp. LH 10-3-1]|uniref:Uncharacterized protein n=1 Tax=Salinispirillum sp. LH 10-3-1 TaxID=2952525 RepID=A0AB38YCC6_9GAMM
MKNTNDINIVMNAWGEVDVAYYEALARKMRAEAMAELTTKAFKAVVQRIRQLFTPARVATSA